MVRQLIDLAAVDVSQGSAKDDEVDIAALVGDVALELETQLAANDVRVAVDLPDQARPPAVTRGDHVLVRLAIRNLIENAIQNSPQGAEVRCRVVLIAGKVVVEILDQGPGISLAGETRVTERFYRGSKAHGHGSGLGVVDRADGA